MLAIILFAVLAVAVLAPETPLGKAVRQCLIDVPARKLNSLKRAHWLAVIVAVGMLLALFVYAKTEGVMLFAQGLPEALSWFAMFDVATYIDAMAVIALLAATVRLRTTYLALRSAATLVRRWVLTCLRRFRPTQGCRRNRRRRALPTALGDSKEEDAGWRFPVFSLA